MESPQRLRGLAPVIGASPRVLILGSFPSAKSLEKGQYYGNERNHFWPIAAALAGFAEPPAAYTARLSMLRGAGIALWDVYAEASRRRPGSLDRDLVEPSPNPVERLLRECPGIATIGLNGGEAAAAFARRFGTARLSRAGDETSWYVAGRNARLIRLPSSSPVPSERFRTREDRLAVWRRLLEPRG